MAPQIPEDGFVRMPKHEFEATLTRAAKEVAQARSPMSGSKATRPR